MIRSRVVEIVDTELGFAGTHVTLDTHIYKDLGADSIDTFELTMAIEEEFDMDIPDEDAERWQTVFDIVRYMEGISSLASTHDAG